MAPPDGKTPDPLTGPVAEDSASFEFFAAVRLIQARFRAGPRIGHSWSPSQDPVRFAQSPALDFAPSTIESLRRKSPDRPPVMYSRHFGLFGPNGPLPFCLTEYARQRILHHGDPTFVAFCNVFHHRLSSFFFRAWADAQKTLDLDRPEDRRWAGYIGALSGLGMESLEERDRIPDSAKLYFAGRTSQQSRGAEGLEAILQDFFGIPTVVETFVGRWLDLPSGAECRLGASPATGCLGTTAIVGSRMWTCQMHFRLRLGPMSLADFERMLPAGEAFARLRDWVRLYVGEEFSWDVRLVLRAGDVPPARLGTSGRLGWTTWMSTRPMQGDVEVEFAGSR